MMNEAIHSFYIPKDVLLWSQGEPIAPYIIDVILVIHCRSNAR